MKSTQPVLLFPGHAAYLESALAALRDDFPEVEAVLTEIDEALVADGAVPLAKRLLTEPATLESLLLDDTETLPLCVYATSLVVHRVLCGRGVTPAVLLGHSQGEIAALVAAGAYDVGTGVRILRHRFEAMRLAGHTGDMAVLAAGPHKAAAVVALVDDPHLVLAVDNGVSQCALSGPEPALAHAERIAESAGLSVTRIHVSHAGHNPLLAPAADLFHERIAGLRQRPLRTAVYSPILEREYTDADDITSLLARHLTLPVRFAPAIRQLHGRGAALFVECGARTTLAGRVRSIVPNVTTVVCLDGKADPPVALAAALATLTRPDDRPAATATVATVAPAVAPALKPSATPDVTPTPAPAVTRPVLRREDVLTVLRTKYAEALEYPVEVLDENADLEADLGVDSLKQMELLVRSGEHFGFTRPPSRLRLMEYGTLGRIADLVVAMSADER